MRLTLGLLAVFIVTAATGGAMSQSQQKPRLSSSEEAFERAVSLEKAGKRNDAISALVTVIGSDSQHAEAWLLLGKIYIDEGNPMGAESALKNALSLGANSPSGPLTSERAAEARRLLELARRGTTSRPPTSQVPSNASSQQPKPVTLSCEISYGNLRKLNPSPSDSTFVASGRMSGCDGKNYWRNVRWMMSGVECEGGNVTNCRERQVMFNCSARVRTIYMQEEEIAAAEALGARRSDYNWGVAYGERRYSPNDPNASDCTPMTAGAVGAYVKSWTNALVLSHTCACRDPD